MFISEVLSKRTSLKRFCKVDITDALKLESVYLAKYKYEVEEDKRKKKEAAEAEAARKAEEEENKEGWIDFVFGLH